jgi:hypothetical protein
MKATIEVADRKEADAIRVGLEDPTVRACVVVMGALATLPIRARMRVLECVIISMSEPRGLTVKEVLQFVKE